ncbi:hypothetical protein [Tsukamurella pseudospumae]|nr:hypothetical protein [Tsukamurella pseudospumae]
MPEYKTIECYASELEHQTAYYGRDGWRRGGVEKHISDDSKIMIEFIRGE